ncbi:MAG: PASTA domain-containing protein [Bacteroidaceae bacterium]|nr:PASTA domain-containing protein [Bacteroidaceae bacterium]
MSIKDCFSHRAQKVLWSNLLAMLLVLIAIIAGAWVWLGAYTQHGQSVVNPSVRGLNQYEAIKLLKAGGLEVEISDSIYQKTKPAGCIIEQSPQAGLSVKQGRVIYLTINSKSVPMTQLPDVGNNSSLRQATAKLLSCGFHLTQEEYISGDRDWVYEVKLNGRKLATHESVPVGAILTLVVGNGMTESSENDSLSNDMEDPSFELNSTTPSQTTRSGASHPSSNTQKPTDKKGSSNNTEGSGSVREDSWF